MISYSEDQARAFVTDAGTLQRGQQLAHPTKWGNLGRTETTAWGECAGSGSKPYLTGIDLSEPAFKCTCPSRVFPCKHGAGLLLLLARQPALFAGSAPPAWLEEWLSKRQQTQGKKTDKVTLAVSKAADATPETSPSEAADSSASAVPAGPGNEVSSARLARMVQGVDELELWLLDLVRNGLATLDQQPGKFWESQAARLVDNQLPGLAGTVRELATLRHAHADWPARLLARLGELYWLVRAFQNREQLPAATRQDVLQQVGVTIKKEELPGYTAPVTDEWRVLGQFTWEEDRLTARRSWLRGERTGRHALVLEFAFGSQPFATPLVPQGRYTGALLFYPGPLPLRAAPVALTYVGSAPAALAPPAASPSRLLSDYADALALQPWLREWPAAVAQVVPTRQPDGRWVLHHPNDGALPLRFAHDDAPWELLAESGGHPLTLFGEWDGRAFRPLSNWRGDTISAVPVVSTSEVAVFPPGSEPTADSPEAALPSPAQVLRIALLGTRQSGELLPASQIGSTPTDSPEQQLLLAAGTLALVQKAGSRPPTAPAPPPPASPETWEPLGPIGASLLDQFLAGKQRYYYRHFYRLEAVQRRVPHRQLVGLLNYAVKNRYQIVAEHAAVLGTHGQWLATQNSDWEFIPAAASPEAQQVKWETGSSIIRRTYLAEVYENDPARAVELLAEALPQENAATQVTLLTALHGDAFTQRFPLPAALGPVLEPFLKSRAREVRQSATQLLAQTTGNALVPRLWTRAEPLLAIRKSLLGRKRLEISLPDNWTTAWQHDGIEQKTSDYPGGEKAGWLGQLMALLPPQQWAERWQLTPAQAVALVAASDWPNVLLPAWLRAARLYEDAAFVRALLDHEAEHPTQAAHLVVAAGRILPEAEKLDWLLSLLPKNPSALPKPPHWVEWLLIPTTYDYPEALLHRALPLLATLLSQPWQPEHSIQEQAALQLLVILSEDADETLLPLFEKHLSPVLEAQPRLAPELTAVLAAFRNRQLLTASLTEPATTSPS